MWIALWRLALEVVEVAACPRKICLAHLGRIGPASIANEYNTIVSFLSVGLRQT